MTTLLTILVLISFGQQIAIMTGWLIWRISHNRSRFKRGRERAQEDMRELQERVWQIEAVIQGMQNTEK